MEELFLTLVNLSLTASWLVLAVLVLRLLLRKAPRWSFCLLWGLVALRLMFPFSLESPFSLVPSTQPLPREILHTATPQIQSGIPAVNSAVNPILQEALAPAAGASVNPTQVWSFLLSRIWLAGMVVLLLYALISWLLLKRRLATATLLEDNIRQSEQVGSPFVLGLFRPVIYLPYHIPEQDLTYVLTHERAHIRRLDHWWKLLGFVLLAIYWFNPLMWVAYLLFCRDLEGACDEKAVRALNQEERRGYSTALLNCSIRRRPVAPCPLAFGEAGVKSRVKAVMHYKKPAFWVVVIALAACVIAALCFLTSPKEPTVYDVLTQDGYEVLGQEQVELTLTIPKSALTDDCYTGEGHTFADGQVVVWQDDATTIYLHTEDSSVSPQILLRSKILRDGTTTYPDALNLRGYGPGAKFTFYVSKDACIAAQDTLMIDVICNQVQYAKEGHKTSEDQPSLAGFYCYEGDGFGGDFTITLRADGSFTYYEGHLSSYIGAGKWSVSGDILTLEDETGIEPPIINHFRMDENNLIFQEKGSSNFIYVKVADGAVFSKNSEVNPPFLSTQSAEVHGTTFLYDSKQYDLSQRNSAINAITNQYQIGDYLIFEGHTGPQNGVYCIFNTVTQTFEPDIQGANPTWLGSDIRSIVYSFWSDVYAYDGTLLASLPLNEGDHINGLRYLDDPTQLEVQIMTASGDSYTELIQLTNAQ